MIIRPHSPNTSKVLEGTGYVIVAIKFFVSSMNSICRKAPYISIAETRMFTALFDFGGLLC